MTDRPLWCRSSAGSFQLVVSGCTSLLPSLNVCYVNLQLGNNTSPSEMYFNLKKQTIFFVAIAQNLVSFRQWMVMDGYFSGWIFVYVSYLWKHHWRKHFWAREQLNALPCILHTSSWHDDHGVINEWASSGFDSLWSNLHFLCPSLLFGCLGLF